MTDTFAIYVRVSEVGDREGSDSYASPEVQEAAAREWIERQGADAYYVEDECLDEDVSGALAASDRKLGKLIDRCVAGEFAGIVVRDETRFARDTIEGGAALDRLNEAGARLKATLSGFDSENLTPESRMVFDIMMSIGKAQRARNRQSRMAGSQRAVEQGFYLASSAPLGYKLVERRTRADGSPGVGKLALDPETAPHVQAAFRMRAERASYLAIMRYLNSHGIKIGKSGVRVLFSNRAYLGEATAPTTKKGELTIYPNHHDALVTLEQFEDARAAEGVYIPRDGSITNQVGLGGLVVCVGCGKRMQVQKSQKKHGVSYVCRTLDCTQRSGIRADKLDPFVSTELTREVTEGNPFLLSILQGDDRYQRALAAVTTAQAELDAYRTNIKITDVGAEAWKADVATRTASLKLAREQLSATPKPKGGETVMAKSPDDLRDVAARFIDRIEVRPVGRGRQVEAGERVTIWWVGELASGA